jgi:hypothetical protein
MSETELTENKCGWCGAPLPPNDPRGLPRKYCSASHRTMAYRARQAEPIEEIEHEIKLLPTPTRRDHNGRGYPNSKSPALPNVVIGLAAASDAIPGPPRRLVHRKGDRDE